MGSGNTKVQEISTSSTSSLKDGGNPVLAFKNIQAGTVIADKEVDSTDQRALRDPRPSVTINTGSLKVHAELCQPSIPYHQSKVRVMCTVSAEKTDQPSGNAVSEPVGLCIVAIVDTSASMSGPKLKLLQSALIFLLQQLRPIDYFSVISFNDEAKVALPPQLLANASVVQQAANVINELKAEKNTDLYGGMQLGLEKLKEIATAKKWNRHTSLCSVWLFTDGEANVGEEIEPEKILGDIRHMLFRLPAHTSLFTFGFGTQHNDNLLKELAEAGSGMYYYLCEQEHISKAFADCLGGLLSVVAQEIEIKIEAKSDATELTLLNDVPVVSQKKKRAVLALNDVSEEEQVTLLFDLTVAVLNRPRELIKTLVTVQLTYYDLVSKKPVSDILNLTVDRPESSTVVSNPLSDLSRLSELAAEARIEASKAMLKARMYVSKENANSAEQTLDHAIEYIKSSGAKEDPVCVAVMADLVNCRRSIVTNAPVMTSLALAYAKEKSTVNSNQDIYRTSMKTQYTSKAKESYELLKKELKRELEMLKPTSDSKYDFEHYSLGEVLGRGSAGTVRRAVGEGGDVIAIKTVSINENDPKIMGLLRRELTVLRNLRGHTHLVTVFRILAEKARVHVFMEYCPMTLQGKLSALNGQPMPLTDVASACSQILSGLAFLHSNNIIHRDVKPENILFTSDGILKIADFGAGKVIGEGANAQTRIGTMKYMAPEILFEGEQSTLTDVWSLGILAVELAINGSPWKHCTRGDLDIARYLKGEKIRINDIPFSERRDRPDFDLPPSVNDADFIHFVAQCLRLDPAERLPCKDLSGHPFLTKYSK